MCAPAACAATTTTAAAAGGPVSAAAEAGWRGTAALSVGHHRAGAVAGRPKVGEAPTVNRIKQVSQSFG